MAEKTVEQLQAENAELKKKLEKTSASLGETKGQVKDLSQQLQVAEATRGSKLPTVKVDGEPFIFTGPRARVGKVVVKAEDAAKDAKLCKELVTKGSGWLKAVNIAKSETAKADPDEAE